MIHTVIFDVGGTLVNANSVFHAFADAMDNSRREELFRFMRPIFFEYYRDEHRPDFLTIKQIASLVVQRAANQFGLEDISPRVPELYADYYLGGAQPFDDVVPALEKLKKQGKALIALSDADADVLEREMETFSLKKYFDKVIVSSNVEAYKPSDKMVAYIRERINPPYHQILLVGDNEVDIMTAAKLKVHSALIRRNGQFPIAADYQISSMPEIFGIISELENE